MQAMAVLKETHTEGETVEHVFFSPAQDLIQRLLSSSLILAEDWDELPRIAQENLERRHPEAVLSRLVEQGLLTQCQADRVEAGTTLGLVLGNYRVLDRIGAGGIGV